MLDTLALLMATPVRGRMVAARLFSELPRRVILRNWASDKYDSRKLRTYAEPNLLDTGSSTSRKEVGYRLLLLLRLEPLPQRG